MGDLATLLTAIGSVITALAGAAGIVITAARTSRRERSDAAEEAAEDVLKAIADGEFDEDELEELRRRLRQQGRRHHREVD